jgi:hypothetical protein
MTRRRPRRFAVSCLADCYATPEPSLTPPEPRIEPGIAGWCWGWKRAVVTGDLCLYADGGLPCHDWCGDFERREEKE